MKAISNQRLYVPSDRCSNCDLFMTVAAKRQITCHRNEPTERRRRDTGINTKSMINWPVRRGGLEVGIERHLLRVGIALYIQRPIVARTGSQATFCFPRFWISSLSQLLHSTGQVHGLRACNYVAQSEQARTETRIARNIAHRSSVSSNRLDLD